MRKLVQPQRSPLKILDHFLCLLQPAKKQPTCRSSLGRNIFRQSQVVVRERDEIIEQRQQSLLKRLGSSLDLANGKAQPLQSCAQFDRRLKDHIGKLQWIADIAGVNEFLKCGVTPAVSQSLLEDLLREEHAKRLGTAPIAELELVWLPCMEEEHLLAAKEMLSAVHSIPGYTLRDPLEGECAIGLTNGEVASESI